mmetsp:Transcript_94397/g.266664  ORF Transcript_94397/g.266664 Transcript_94397/m.266664 type:complete len:234 (+) Transcript_94397:839-1540(+)
MCRRRLDHDSWRHHVRIRVQRSREGLQVEGHWAADSAWCTSGWLRRRSYHRRCSTLGCHWHHCHDAGASPNKHGTVLDGQHHPRGASKSHTPRPHRDADASCNIAGQLLPARAGRNRATATHGHRLSTKALWKLAAATLGQPRLHQRLAGCVSDHDVAGLVGQGDPLARLVASHHLAHLLAAADRRSMDVRGDPNVHPTRGHDFPHRHASMGGLRQHLCEPSGAHRNTCSAAI